MNHTCDKNESILNSLPINAPPMDKFGKITRVLDVENDFDTTILPNGVYICKIKLPAIHILKN
jgi:hypothetical protein